MSRGAFRPFVTLLMLAAMSASGWAGYWLWQYYRDVAAPLFGIAVEGYPVTEGTLNQTRTETGLIPRIACFYLQWPLDPSKGEFPSESLERIWDSGAIPCITWEPMYIDGTREVTINYRDILLGVYDPYIDRFAQAAAEFKRPIVIRFAHEMNLDRYHWGVEKSEFGASSPEIYRAIFRYVVQRVRRTPAAYIQWAFNPNAESIPRSDDPASSWNRIANYYPGDDVVGVLGLDGYNWTPPSQEGSRSFADVFEKGFGEIRSLSQKKPIFVFETASEGTPAEKAHWLQDGLEATRSWGLYGVVWFQVNKERDWRLVRQSPVDDKLQEVFRLSDPAMMAQKLNPQGMAAGIIGP